MENVLFVVGGIFTIYFASLAINWFVIQVVTSSDGGPFGIQNRVFDLVIDRDYLELEWRDNIVRLCHWGGFLLWMFFVYVLVRDILIKIEKSKQLRRRNKMHHNEVSAICRRLVAETLNIKDSEISTEPWDQIIYDFAEEASEHNYPEATINEKFRESIAEKLLTQRELHEFWANSMQRHHDYYVFLHREEHGNLNSGDMAQYDLAMQREHDGLCRPLRKDAVSPYG